MKTTRPIRLQFPDPQTKGPSALGRLFRDAGDAFYQMLLYCWTQDASRLGRCSKQMAHAVFSDAALPQLQRATEAALGGTVRKGLQLQGGRLWMHALVSMPVVNAYAKAVKEAKAEFHVPELVFTR